MSRMIYQNQNAITSYKQILKINPNHEHARKNLNVLEQNIVKPIILTIKSSNTLRILFSNSLR